jgi:ADP-heptose:LPS heptosyltransferase
MKYTAGARNPLQLFGLWWKLLCFRPDILIYLMPIRSGFAVKRDALFFRMAGVREIIGLPDHSTSSHNLDVDSGLFEKEASRLARAVAILGDASPERLENWDMRLTEAEKKTASRVLSSLHDAPLIVCAPGTKMQAKDWGSENWYMLLERLSVIVPQHALVFIGAEGEKAISESIARAWAGKTINLCGSLSPRETCAVIARGAVFLGPDSGPMHLAAAAGVPVAIPFSARDKPGIWFPIGRRNQIIYHKTDCFGCKLEVCAERKKACLSSISVDEMYSAALRALTLSDLSLFQFEDINRISAGLQRAHKAPF